MSSGNRAARSGTGGGRPGRPAAGARGGRPVRSRSGHDRPAGARGAGDGRRRPGGARRRSGPTSGLLQPVRPVSADGGSPRIARADGSFRRGGPRRGRDRRRGGRLVRGWRPASIPSTAPSSIRHDTGTMSAFPRRDVGQIGMWTGVFRSPTPRAAIDADAKTGSYMTTAAPDPLERTKKKEPAQLEPAPEKSCSTGQFSTGEIASVGDGRQSLRSLRETRTTGMLIRERSRRQDESAPSRAAWAAHTISSDTATAYYGGPQDTYIYVSGLPIRKVGPSPSATGGVRPYTLNAAGPAPTSPGASRLLGRRLKTASPQAVKFRATTRAWPPRVHACSVKPRQRGLGARHVRVKPGARLRQLGTIRR